MNARREVITISVLVESRSLMDKATQETVPFKVFKEDQSSRAVPLLADAERKCARLPEVIAFSFIDQCIVTEHSLSEDTLEVIKNMIQELIVKISLMKEAMAVQQLEFSSTAGHCLCLK